MIWIMIRAAIVTFILWLGIKLGRGSVVYELCHLQNGDIKEMSDDLVYFYSLFQQFHGGDQNE